MKCSTVICNGLSANVAEESQSHNMSINYCYTESNLGGAMIASTSSGLCFLGFVPNERSGVEELCKRFSKASLTPYIDQHIQHTIEHIEQIESGKQAIPKIPLHLIGTPFQLKVWKALLTIPYAELTTYSHVANSIADPKAVRAAASAIGKNPIAILVPCHRVVRIGGQLGGYHWGLALKERLLKIEERG